MSKLHYKKTFESTYLKDGCYYCDKKGSEEGTPVKKFMYLPYADESDEADLSIVKVPRCNSCESKHGWSEMGVLPTIFIIYIIMSLLGITKSEHWNIFWGAILCMLIAVGVYFYFIETKIVPLFTGSRAKDDVDEYGPIQSLIDKGWVIGSTPDDPDKYQ